MGNELVRIYSKKSLLYYAEDLVLRWSHIIISVIETRRFMQTICKVSLWSRCIPEVSFSAQLTETMEAHLKCLKISQNIVSQPELHHLIIKKYCSNSSITIELWQNYVFVVMAVAADDLLGHQQMRSWPNSCLYLQSNQNKEFLRYAFAWGKAHKATYLYNIYSITNNLQNIYKIISSIMGFHAFYFRIKSLCVCVCQIVGPITKVRISLYFHVISWTASITIRVGMKITP